MKKKWKRETGRGDVRETRKQKKRTVETEGKKKKEDRKEARKKNEKEI